MEKKNCKKCWTEFIRYNTIQNICSKCMIEKNKDKQKTIYHIKRTEIKKVWKKRTERINEKWSEMRMFIEIWKERSHECKVCWNFIKFFHTSNFAHILWKKDYPDLRYEKENIALVHWIFEIENEETWKTYQCHQKLDKETSWKKLEIYEKLIKKLDKK